MTFRTSLSVTGRMRRSTILRLGAACAWLAAGRAHAQARGPIKVAAVYTVPIGQQWVSRVHRALILARTRGEIDYTFSENVSHGMYERALRKYAEQGVQLIVGEAFRAED
ncbi:MAG TPA: BMP family ABC transporter substrate-binding protein, partial [Bordetella sp.]|nr:BMP family ABC transporter substrate-binding protein [Bordetella sp.]